MKITVLLISFIILLAFVIAFLLYPSMPEQMASHWNAAGQVDGYMPKLWALFLMPTISVILFVLFIFVPRIDPLKENIKEFRGYFDIFIVLLFSFLFYIYLLTIAWNQGISFNMVVFMIPALAILFFYVGVLLEKAKQNWFIGIRTPWTLSNELVWNKTHQLGGKLFKISGVVAVAGLFFEKYAIYFVLAPILISSFYTMVYSYFEFKKETK